MICPRCANTLTRTLRYRVWLTHCPVCGGIWIDRDQIDELARQVERRDAERRRAEAERARRRGVVNPAVEPAPRTKMERILLALARTDGEEE
ncbi:TFIIB-type zinc ribbon-containing protein [Deferrisoma sp.]